MQTQLLWPLHEEISPEDFMRCIRTDSFRDGPWAGVSAWGCDYEEGVWHGILHDGRKVAAEPSIVAVEAAKEE